MRKQIFVIPISVVVTILYSKLFIALIISIVLKVQSLTVLSSNIRLKHNPSLSLLCMHQRVKTESPLLSLLFGIRAPFETPSQPAKRRKALVQC